MHVTQLRQPPGSGVVVACTAKRELLMWQHNPGAAFRTFTARQTWYHFLPKQAFALFHALSEAWSQM